MKTIDCMCDMPDWAYFDWLQDQGWDIDEFRQSEEILINYNYNRNEFGNGWNGYWHGYGDGNRYANCGNGYEYGNAYGNGNYYD